jgi:predicted nucleic acid-binding protein
LSFYLDASAIVPNLVEEAGSEAVRAFVARCEPDVVVSALATLETSSALSRLARMGSITTDGAISRLIRFDAWRAPYSVSPPFGAAEFELADALVRRFELGLRGPDALHLAACLRGGHTLATLDRRLADAAAALGVATTVPT